MEKNKHYAGDTVFLIVGASIDRVLSSVRRCHFARMNVVYTRIVIAVISDGRGRARGKSEPVRLRSKILEVQECCWKNNCVAMLIWLSHAEV